MHLNWLGMRDCRNKNRDGSKTGVEDVSQDAFAGENEAAILSGCRSLVGFPGGRSTILCTYLVPFASAVRVIVVSK